MENNNFSEMSEDDTYVVEGLKPIQPLLNMTLGELFFEKLSDPTRLSEDAMVDANTGRAVTYQHILETSYLLAQKLKKCGYLKGSIFSICSENNLEFFIPVLACFHMGATIAPLNQNYTDTELSHCLQICKPKVIFCSLAVAEKFARLKKLREFSFIENILIIDSREVIMGCQSMQNFISDISAPMKVRAMVKSVERDFDPTMQVACIMCSSGTTGLPKGVMQTHNNLMVRYMHQMDPRFGQSEGNFLGILPFFHGFGFITNLFALCLGKKVIVIKRFEEKLFLQTIQDYKIRCLWIAPPIVVFLAKSPLVSQYDLSCVTDIASGAAPLSKETEELVKRRLNLKHIRQGYGLTESTLAVIMIPLDENTGKTMCERKPGSTGTVISYMKCKVRDPETGKSLPPHKVGEICIKGPMVMKGYYGNPEATRGTFTKDGWLLTGDLGYYDEQGYFYIVDRIKELIKYKGFQVAPAELEAVLLSHPNIIDVGVVGRPAGDIGELPTAFIVKKPGSQLTEREVEDFVVSKVSYSKKLRGGVIFVPAIPKNPSGKILRRELKKIVAKYNSKL